MFILFVLMGIMSSFMLFFVIDISYNLRRMNNKVTEFMARHEK